MKACTLSTTRCLAQGFRLVIVLIAALALAGCGGGGGGSSSTTAAPTPGVSAGQITGFGSIIVNGVRFHTGGATLEFEDGSEVPLSNTLNDQDLLSRGMEVEVEGSFDDNGNGTATRVFMDSTLDGPLQILAVNGNVHNFTILGQSVIALAGSTTVDNGAPLFGSLSNLLDGMVIEVHGLPDGNGTVQASFIEFKFDNVGLLPAGTLFELTGRAINLDTNNFTFDIGNQSVSYSGVTPRDGVLAEGSLVEVKGLLSGLNFVAADIEIKDGFDDQAKTEVEGLITALNIDAKTFMLRGQQVNYAGAQFLGGLEAELLNGLKVEAEGPITSGILLAVKIKFKDNFRYEGDSTLIGNVLTISNPAGPDLAITIDISLTLGTTTGGQVKVRARQLSGENLVATRVETGGNTDRQIFEAAVVRIADPLVGILDTGNGATGVIVIDTSTISPDSSGSNFEIEDVETTRAAFFAALQVGDIVKARWDVGGAQWDQIEIELDD